MSVGWSTAVNKEQTSPPSQPTMVAVITSCVGGECGDTRRGWSIRGRSESWTGDGIHGHLRLAPFPSLYMRLSSGVNQLLISDNARPVASIVICESSPGQ